VAGQPNCRSQDAFSKCCAFMHRLAVKWIISHHVVRFLWIMSQLRVMVHSHTLGWDEMGWAALVIQCISMNAFAHWVTSAAKPIPVPVCVCLCVNAPLYWLLTVTCFFSDNKYCTAMDHIELRIRRHRWM